MIEGLSAVVPIYNETEALEVSLSDLRAALSRLGVPYEVVVVDDGSSDGSGELLQRMDGLRVLRNPSNLGYGAAVKRGIRACRYEHLLLTDGDASYPASNIEVLVQAHAGEPMTVGCRDFDSIDNPATWNLAKRLCQRLLAVLLGSAIPDINSGMRIIERDLALELETHLSDGFSYTTGLTVGALRRGRAVRFVPIRYAERLGSSKVRPIGFTLAFVRSILLAWRCPPP